jgi:hypothetical protein
MKLKRLWFSVSLIILLTMALLCGKKGDNSALQNFAMIDFLAQAAGGGGTGGGSYMAIGTATCAAGWSIAFTGITHVTEVAYSSMATTANHSVYRGGGELFCAPVDLSTYRATNGFTSVLKVASGATNLQCVLCVK